MPLNIPQNSHIIPSFVDNMQAAEGNEQELRRQSLMNTYQGLQNDRYGQMTPLEVMIREKEAAQAQALNNPNSLDLYRQGQEGEWRSKAATGQFDEGVLKDKMASEVAKYRASVPEFQYKQEMAELENLDRALTFGLPKLAQIPPGMMRNQAAIQMARQFGIDPRMIGQLAASGGLDNLDGMQQLQTQIKNILVNTTKQKQEMQKEVLKSDTEIKKANITAAASRYGADQRKKDYEADELATLRKEAAKGNPEAFLMLADRTDDPKEKARNIELAKQAALRREAERKAATATQIDVSRATEGQVPVVGSDNPYRETQKTDGKNLQAEANKAFGSYEPNKYDYRIGPNGTIQRKKK